MLKFLNIFSLDMLIKPSCLQKKVYLYFFVLDRLDRQWLLINYFDRLFYFYKYETFAWSPFWKKSKIELPEYQYAQDRDLPLKLKN